MEDNMRVKNNKKLVSWLLCMMLIVAMALTTVGCGTDEQNGGQPAENASSADSNVTVLGEGKTQFGFTVVDKDGNATEFEIHTDKATVGEALLELNLIAGDEGEYGLYVKQVNGITADYDVDQTYWAFYVNDAYATSGVDTTAVEADARYAFKVEK